MLIAFELSGEHETIPASEVMSCLKSQNADFQILYSLDNCLIIDLKSRAMEIIEKISTSLALTHHIIEVLGIGGSNEQEILEMIRKNMPDFEGTYRVRVKRVRDHSTINTESMEGKIGAILYNKGKRANLKNPKMQFRVVLTEDKSIFGILLSSIDRSAFEARKPHNKPFFYPGVLMPRVARALVNISMPQEYLLDPFCGTGGILVEAGLIGIKVIGGDMQRKILLGAKMNLQHFGSDYFLMFEDACRLALRDESVDAVVTDPPYGRSAAIKADSLGYMLSSSLEEIHRVLKSGKRAVFVSERPIEDLAKNAAFKVMETHIQRVHKSLTRRIVVLEK